MGTTTSRLTNAAKLSLPPPPPFALVSNKPTTRHFHHPGSAFQEIFEFSISFRQLTVFL